MVVFFVLFTAAVLWVFAYGPGKEDPVPAAPEAGRHAAQAYPVTADPVAADPAEADPAEADPAEARACAAEAVLVHRLLTGAMAAADYHGAMAELAAVDAARRPAEAPPEREG